MYTCSIADELRKEGESSVLVIGNGKESSEMYVDDVRRVLAKDQWLKDGMVDAMGFLVQQVDPAIYLFCYT